MKSNQSYGLLAVVGDVGCGSDWISLYIYIYEYRAPPVQVNRVVLRGLQPLNNVLRV